MTSTSGIDDPGNRPSRRKQKSPRKNSSFCENDRFGYPENAMSDEKIDDATSNVIMLPDSESEMDHVSQGSLPYPVCVIPNVNNADTENSSFYSNILDSNGLSATTSLNRINPIQGLSMTQSSQSNVLEIVPIDDNDSIENCSTEEYKSKPGQTEEHIPPLSELDMPNASGQPASITCNECGRKFAKRHQLEVHKLMGHDVKQKFRCPHCRLFFPFKSVLASHVKSAHSGQLLQQLEGKKNNTRFSLDKTFNSCFGEHKTVYMYKEAHGKPLLEGKYIVVKENEAITCFNCDFEIKTVEKMQTHYADDHSDWKLVVICPNCMRECHTLKKVEHHLRSKKCMRLTALCCKPCGISFDSPETHMLHVNECNREEVKHQCQICRKTFTQRLLLMVHVEKGTCKRNKLYKKRNHQMYSCVFCGRSFALRHELDLHLFQRHHVRNHYAKKKLSCAKCDASFNTMAQKHQHQNAKHRDLKCEKCDKMFAFRSALRKHISRHNDAKLMCPICQEGGRLFSSPMNVRSHVRRVHFERYEELFGWAPSKTIFTCEFCGSEWSTANELRKHRRVHTNERPFQCQYCEKAFKQPRHTKTHMMMVHKEKWEEVHGPIHYKHKCPICDKLFLLKCGIDKHMRFHARQKLNSIEAEIRVQTADERLFECDKCEKNFKTASHLKTHFMYKHPDFYTERYGEVKARYDCKECNKTYFNQHALKTHFASKSHEQRILKITMNLIAEEKDASAIHKPDKKLEIDSVPLEKEERVVSTNKEIMHRHACSVCGEKFQDDRKMRAHFVNFHQEQYESMYSDNECCHICIDCDRRFAFSSDLKYHMAGIAHRRKVAQKMCTGEFIPERKFGPQSAPSVRCTFRPQNLYFRSENNLSPQTTISQLFTICSAKSSAALYTVKSSKDKSTAQGHSLNDEKHSQVKSQKSIPYTSQGLQEKLYSQRTFNPHCSFDPESTSSTSSSQSIPSEARPCSLGLRIPLVLQNTSSEIKTIPTPLNKTYIENTNARDISMSVEKTVSSTKEDVKESDISERRIELGAEEPVEIVDLIEITPQVIEIKPERH